MKLLKDLTATIILTINLYVVTFIVIVWVGAQEFNGRGAPYWQNAISYALMTSCVALTLWAIVLLAQKYTKNRRR